MLVVVRFVFLSFLFSSHVVQHRRCTQFRGTLGNLGDALGRYMGLNAFSDGVVGVDGEIITYDQWGGLISFSRRFSPHWQAGVTLSAAWADLPGENRYPNAGQLPDHYASGHLNLWYRPTPSLAFGSEYIRAVKELHNGDSGSVDRLMFSLRYTLK